MQSTECKVTRIYSTETLFSFNNTESLPPQEVIDNFPFLLKPEVRARIEQLRRVKTNAWLPRSMRKCSPDEEYEGMLKSILNKMSPESKIDSFNKFIEIMDKYLTETLDNVKMKKLVEMIVDVAVRYTLYVEFFANFCSEIDENLRRKPFMISLNKNVSPFLVTLLNECQLRFTTGPKARNENDDAEKDYITFLMFMSELFKCGKFENKILMSCIGMLIKQSTVNSILGAMEIIKRIASKLCLDPKQGRRNSEKLENFMIELSNNELIKSEREVVSYIYLNLVDIQFNQWQPINLVDKMSEKNKPKSLREIKKQFEATLIDSPPRAPHKFNATPTFYQPSHHASNFSWNKYSKESNNTPIVQKPMNIQVERSQEVIVQKPMNIQVEQFIKTVSIQMEQSQKPVSKPIEIVQKPMSIQVEQFIKTVSIQMEPSQKPVNKPIEIVQKPVNKPIEIVQKPVSKPIEISRDEHVDGNVFDTIMVSSGMIAQMKYHDEKWVASIIDSQTNEYFNAICSVNRGYTLEKMMQEADPNLEQVKASLNKNFTYIVLVSHPIYDMCEYKCSVRPIISVDNHSGITIISCDKSVQNVADFSTIFSNKDNVFANIIMRIMVNDKIVIQTISRPEYTAYEMLFKQYRFDRWKLYLEIKRYERSVGVPLYRFFEVTNFDSECIEKVYRYYLNLLRKRLQNQYSLKGFEKFPQMNKLHMYFEHKNVCENKVKEEFDSYFYDTMQNNVDRVELLLEYMASYNESLLKKNSPPFFNIIGRKICEDNQ